MSYMSRRINKEYSNHNVFLILLTSSHTDYFITTTRILISESWASFRNDLEKFLGNLSQDFGVRYV